MSMVCGSLLSRGRSLEQFRLSEMQVRIAGWLVGAWCLERVFQNTDSLIHKPDYSTCSPGILDRMTYESATWFVNSGKFTMTEANSSKIGHVDNTPPPEHIVKRLAMRRLALLLVGFLSILVLFTST